MCIRDWVDTAVELLFRPLPAGNGVDQPGELRTGSIQGAGETTAPGAGDIHLAVTVLHQLLAQNRRARRGVEGYVGASVGTQQLAGYLALDAVLLVIEAGAQQPGGIIEEQHVPPLEGHRITLSLIHI